MWRRYRRKSLAPRRPALFEEQYALALLTAIVLIGSIVAVVLVFAHS
jgi:hypothetical protein